MNWKQADRIAERLNGVIFGLNRTASAFYAHEFDDDWYIITTGTGDGVFAYDAEAVAEWLLAVEDYTDEYGNLYEEFCDNLMVETAPELAASIYNWSLDTLFRPLRICWAGTCSEVELPVGTLREDDE